ncbi:hypothetical protein BJN34_12915 [Cupriavidus necator]|uniref:Uncharacterized protein n=1 Tax=Cupriavidus necator TaxID=106590 RepID=A0A1U9UQ34_CUPNE|nr:hypothetical protein [Cupriavidus necator]AQV94782.1 hypothetical protein BJN34_12915 [Cupriavidus necator]
MWKSCFLAGAILIANSGFAQSNADMLSGCLLNAEILYRVAQQRDRGLSKQAVLERIARVNDPLLAAVGPLAADLAYSLPDHTPGQLKQFQVNECRKTYAGKGQARGAAPSVASECYAPGANPVYGKCTNGKFVGYFAQTGKPVYGTCAHGGQLKGYDPETGTPVYGHCG